MRKTENQQNEFDVMPAGDIQFNSKDRDDVSRNSAMGGSLRRVSSIRIPD